MVARCLGWFDHEPDLQTIRGKTILLIWQNYG